jgi:hypothetical protein
MYGRSWRDCSELLCDASAVATEAVDVVDVADVIGTSGLRSSLSSSPVFDSRDLREFESSTQQRPSFVGSSVTAFLVGVRMIGTRAGVMRRTFPVGGFHQPGRLGSKTCCDERSNARASTEALVDSDIW